MGMEIVVRLLKGPAEKKAAARQVLEALPAWFAYSAPRERYIEEAGDQAVFAAFGPAGLLGILAMEPCTQSSAEIAVMGVLPQFHRQGVGRRLVEACQTTCRQRGMEFLLVKTLDEANPDPGYAKTRAFYRAMGFRPLKRLPELWGPADPCLVMVQAIQKTEQEKGGTAMQRPMRRQERQMELQQAHKLLEECEYAVLTTVDPEGEPHSVPISPVVEGDRLYFHCAHQGEKLDNIRKNPQVSLCAVTGVRLQPAAFTTAYQSVVAQGRARVAQGEERRQALLHICRKFAPGQQDRWEEEIAKFPNTTVVCVELTRVTGKQNGSQA